MPLRPLLVALIALAGGLTEAERERADVERVEALPLPGVELVSADGDRGAALDALRADPDVRWAQPDRRVHASTEPLWSRLWGLENADDTDIDAPEAWAVS